MKLLVIISAVLLLIFFPGMETAYMQDSKIRLNPDKKTGSFSFKILRLITGVPQHYIMSLRVGYHISLVVAGITFAALFFQVSQIYIHSQPVVLLLQAIVFTLIIIGLSDFIPNTVFRIFPGALLHIFTFPLAFLYVIFYPEARIITGIVNAFIKTDTQKDPGNVFSVRANLKELVNQPDTNSTREKINFEKEVRLFRNALDFSKVKLREIMVPRPEIEMLEVNADIAELKQKFVETGFSRILIYDKNIDNIIGYVASSVIFQNPEFIKPYIKNVLIVPETMPANKLLGTFIKEHRSIAIVVDEFGGTSGMVTSEDILEEIFGEIEDEHDTTDIIEKKIGDNEYIFSGRAEIDLLNEKYLFELPENEEFETLAGLILYHYESIPKINTEITIGKFQIKVLKASNTKIELVKLTIPAD